MGGFRLPLSVPAMMAEQAGDPTRIVALMASDSVPQPILWSLLLAPFLREYLERTMHTLKVSLQSVINSDFIFLLNE